MALQSEFRNFLENKHHIKLDPKKEKEFKKKDRLTPELYKIKKRNEEISKLKKMGRSFKHAMGVFSKVLTPHRDILPEQLFTKIIHHPVHGVPPSTKAEQAPRSATENPPRRSRTDTNDSPGSAGPRF